MTLIHRGEPGFDEAVIGRVFNARRPARRPAAVLLASTEQEVVEGVRLAGERGWKIAVRAGGHSWAAWSVRDEGLLIDLGGLKDIAYDPETGIVGAGPAVKGGDELNPYLAGHGRFFNGGHCPSVGIGGFLLQGGMGWNARGWSWAAENIAAIDVVTADGELVRASEQENADLFWAARGSGPGFFGVVTRFHLRTLPLPRALTETVHVYPAELYDEVMTWLYETHTEVSRDVEIVAVSQSSPEHGRVLVVSALAFVDDHEAAAEALAPFLTCPVLDRALVRADAVPTTLAGQLDRQREANPEGHRYLVDNAWVEGPAEAAVPAMKKSFMDLPTDKAFTIFFSMGPTRQLPDMALSLQTDVYLATYVVYEDEADDERLRGWLTDAMADLQPVTAGQYLGDSDFTTRRLRFLGDAQWRRLQDIRALRDPEGRFAGYLAEPGELNVNHWLR
ncbi:FAD-binding oxidoreductase [Microbispora sp. NPDC046933]|uniref:FAD-binding oxidoreductase n=1 Tax=Microbispora sp. NPDC046933 TaxID=3155618 RepID=UPI0033DE3592